ncbi:MAG: hypothetical protein ACPG7U_04800 [Holosporaceae bacterium]
MHKTLTLGFGTLLLMALVVMHVKYYVASVKRNVHRQEAHCKTLAKKVQTLELEWAFLRTPERLKQLAKRFLTLEPLPPERIEGHALQDAFHHNQSASLGTPKKINV